MLCPKPFALAPNCLRLRCAVCEQVSCQTRPTVSIAAWRVLRISHVSASPRTPGQTLRPCPPDVEPLLAGVTIPGAAEHYIGAHGYLVRERGVRVDDLVPLPRGAASRRHCHSHLTVRCPVLQCRKSVKGWQQLSTGEMAASAQLVTVPMCT